MYADTLAIERPDAPPIQPTQYASRAGGPQLYCDMDGVMADFRRHHESFFGPWPAAFIDVDWDEVRKIPNFFKTIPPMPDAFELWGAIQHLKPIILTGVPKELVGKNGDADNEKVWWIHHHLGPEVPVITCQSKNKFQFCEPGDILIDDWEKYRHKWENALGVWVTHHNAKSTIRHLYDLGIL